MGESRIHCRLRRLTLGVALIAGCSANHGPAAAPADLSNAKSAGLAFLHALADGNAKAARAYSIGTEQDKRWIDAMAALINGLRAYDVALTSKFGQQAVATDIDLKQAIASLVQDPIMRMENAIVKETPPTAELDPALNGMRLAVQPPLYLRQDKDGWKVDLATMRELPSHDPEAVREYLAAGKALQQAAAEIRAGRYKTFEAAQQAVDVPMTQGR